MSGTAAGKRLRGLLFKAIGLALAAFLVWRTVKATGDGLPEALASASYGLLLLNAALYGAVNVVAAWRWRVLLKVQGLEVGLGDVFKMTLIGVFFSNIIPGSVSGDLVKCAYIAARSGGKKAEAILTIAVDRYIGLMGLFAVAIVSSALLAIVYPDLLFGSRIVMLGTGAVCAGGLGMLAVSAAIAMRRRLMAIRPFGRLAAFAAGLLPARAREMASRLVAAIDLYCAHPAAAVEVLCASMGIHSMLAMMNFLIGKAFHERAMSFLQYLICTQIGNATGLFPVTPGGIGIRDSVTAAFLEAFNASPREAMALIPLAYSLTMVLWALIGAIVMLAYGGMTRHED